MQLLCGYVPGRLLFMFDMHKIDKIDLSNMYCSTCSRFWRESNYQYQFDPQSDPQSVTSKLILLLWCEICLFFEVIQFLEGITCNTLFLLCAVCVTAT